MAILASDKILNNAAGAAPFKIPAVRSAILSAIKAEGQAAASWTSAAETLAEHLSFRSLIAPGGKLGVEGATFESLNDDEAFTQGLLLVLDGMAQKLSRRKDSAAISAEDAETLRYVIEDCGRNTKELDEDEKAVWNTYVSELYSKLAQLRNRLWFIQDPVTCVLFAKSTGAPTEKQRRMVLGNPSYSGRIAKYAEAAQGGGRGVKGSRGGKGTGNKRAKTVTAITKASDPVEVLRLIDQYFGSEYSALSELSIMIDALKDEIAAKKAAK